MGGKYHRNTTISASYAILAFITIFSINSTLAAMDIFLLSFILASSYPAIIISGKLGESASIGLQANSLIFCLFCISFGVRWGFADFQTVALCLILAVSSTHGMIMASSSISEIKKIFAENITSGTSIFFSSGLLILFLDNNELFGGLSQQWGLLFLILSIHFSAIMFSSGSNSNLETLEINGKKWLVGMSILFLIVMLYDYSDPFETRSHIWWGLGSYSKLGENLIEFGISGECRSDLSNFDSCWIYPTGWWSPATFIAGFGIIIGVEPIQFLRISTVLAKLASCWIIHTILIKQGFSQQTAIISAFCYLTAPYVLFFGREVGSWPYIEIWFLYFVYKNPSISIEVSNRSTYLWKGVYLLSGVIILGWQAASMLCFYGIALLSYNGMRSKTAQRFMVFAIGSGILSLLIWVALLGRLDSDGLDALFSSSERRSGGIWEYRKILSPRNVSVFFPLIGPIIAGSIISIIILKLLGSRGDNDEVNPAIFTCFPFFGLGASTILLFPGLVNVFDNSLPMIVTGAIFPLSIMIERMKFRDVAFVIFFGTLINLHQYYDLEMEEEHAYHKNLQIFLDDYEGEGFVVIDETIVEDPISYFYAGLNSWQIMGDDDFSDVEAVINSGGAGMVIVSNITDDRMDFPEELGSDQWCRELIEGDMSYRFTYLDYHWVSYSRC